MDEPIDLAHKAAEKGNPWFGLGNLLQPPEESGQEHGVYHHVFTEPGMTMEDVATLLGRIDWERKVRHSAPRERSKRHRVERWQKIRKRQRQAAQRRHARGEP